MAPMTLFHAGKCCHLGGGVKTKRLPPTSDPDLETIMHSYTCCLKLFAFFLLHAQFHMFAKQ